MVNFSLKTGRVIGYDHLKNGHNCQDAITFDQFNLPDGQYTVIVISDGSSVAENNPHLVHTEVGASLTCEFLLEKAKGYLKNYVTPLVLPYFLFDDLIDYYRTLVGHKNHNDAKDYVNFIQHHLLCTALVLVITPRHGLVMRYGDGLIILDDKVLTFDYNDHPPYIAYHLIPQNLKVQASELPQSFESIEFDPNQVSKIAIGTDAFVKNLDLVDLFWGHKHPNQIQRNLNIWSKIEHKLLDDATLAVLEKMEA